MTTATQLAARDDTRLPARLERSRRAVVAGTGMRTQDVDAWLAGRRQAHRFTVERVPLEKIDGWSFEPGSGNVVHRSGRFFSVEGLDVAIDGRAWQQPIIVQPEVGILGILAKEFDGVLHFLMQAKMEPGNPGLLQLSPTVQATYSNYTGVHRGADVKYLEYFTRPGRGRVVADVLQSEHGSWFLCKSNRNMIIETFDEVRPDEDFCWLTLGQIGSLLRRDHVVNMDARSVLACAPMAPAEAGAVRSDTDVLSWFTNERARHEVRARRIPLAEVSDWVRTEDHIRHVDNRYFRVGGVSVVAGNREVTSWMQPLLEPVGVGLCAFLVRRFAGVVHLLVHARAEGGLLDTVELGPTVQCTPQNYAHLPEREQPPFLDLVRRAGADRIRYAALHSDEGGRFHNAVSRCLLVAATEAEAGAEPPPGFAWVTPGQLHSLARHGHYLNMQARTLLAVVGLLEGLL
ncbi:NDP-hexose 2,3-dehydratase family protein [Streptomyces rubradiris]|uniref:NDP-hexose 2,3-dehydratase n=1 Tax=Streptomyces rubradiris TaxID=285531 RepID=Q2PC37_STRRR|nr:NDP-hexose 2,3-dehydratase family protein [Streptomyces rubradiris]CAI94731.1 putative TDP-glucose-2,3-dehydratase [Streptomyces rubradiris]GHH30447.1 NDP-hexose 2,3-dehydratase [Streptomyces rubradiris]GHI52915.1 NDP-hexose 2,3-dehydratase [Streptomyces rubradiris]GHI58179.1 NDP-hexose 2,3-dehydratase [Streptomyces rubradiris]GHI58337.1 NDP-hexose 2,3-dehydratase [Streptomyces rubradiris]